MTKINDSKEKLPSFALLGNPNSGKTTLFNSLTGSKQYVGNWPGVTVEKKEGFFCYNKIYSKIVDLPGVYSLSPYTPEEIVTRNFLLDEDPDIIINIVDATNIERNLYLTTQLLELGKPIVIALNMTDLLEKKGYIINYKELEKRLGARVVPISASKRLGMEELLSAMMETYKSCEKVSIRNIYSSKVNEILEQIEDIITELKPEDYDKRRFISIKLFEGDLLEQRKLGLDKEILHKILKLRDSINTTEFVDHVMIIADERYKFICSLCSECISKSKENKSTGSDKIDNVLTNKFLAFPSFFILIFLIFYITFGPFGNLLKSYVEYFINDIFSVNVSNMLNNLEAANWAKSLVLDGVIKGVGSVLSFLPQIIILFILLSALEDSGYMARAAFIMDRSLRKIGLSGKAFVPMLMGFGCTVPAVLGTRILENKKEKRLTILVMPFMSCSAKMPVYLLIISSFFKDIQPLVIISIYGIGILLGIGTALLFKNSLNKGESSNFVMELPSYKLPTFKSLLIHTWERVKDFLMKAGTVLLGASIVIWFLQSFNYSFNQVSDSSESILAGIGKLIAPIFTLCGFNDWRVSVSLLTGVIAKESIVSSMAVLYNFDTTMESVNALSQTFTNLSAYSFIIFVLLYTPCVAAISAIRKELGSPKWTWISVGYQLVVAWLFSALIYQIGSLVINICH